MKRVIIVHRWGGGPRDDWRPWLQSKLEALGFEVVTPEMPDTEIPVIEKWVDHLAKIVGVPDENTFFVGHSIGCQTILRYLETLENPIGGVFFVAPWFNLANLEDDEVKAIAEPWIEIPIHFEKIKKICPQIKALISNNDPYGFVLENKEILETKLNVEVTVLPNHGHVTEDDGYTELPELLDFFKK